MPRALEAPAPVFEGVAARRVPQNIEAEQALLGAVMYNNKAFYHVSDYLHPHHFYSEVNGLIWMTIQNEMRENRQANAVTLRTHLEGYSLFEDAGGFKYLATLGGAMVTLVNVSDYGRLIYDTWARREIITAAVKLIDEAHRPEPDDTAQVLVERHEAEMLKILGSGTTDNGLKPMRDVLTETLAEWEHQDKGARGVTTGFPDLDKLLGGLHPTDMIVLAGRPASGKSALATNIAFNAARFFRETQDLEHRGKQVAFYSLEMSAEQLGSRILTGETGIVAPRNRWGERVQGDEWVRAQEMVNSLNTLPFWIDDDPGLTLAGIKSRSIRLHRKKPIGLIIIDYIQLISGDARGEQKRLEQISGITRGIKRLAKELKVPVLALSQLSRAIENREEKRPLLSDLRESGTIENDADIVMFAHRQEYYLRAQGIPARKTNETTASYSDRVTLYNQALAECENKCEVIVGKQRHGPLGSVDLHFDKVKTTFTSVSKAQTGRDAGLPDERGDKLPF